MRCIMSTLTQIRAVQSANRYVTPAKNGGQANYQKQTQSPQKATMLFPGSYTTPANVQHWKKGVISLIRGQYPALSERMKIQSSKTIDDNVIKVYCDDDYELKSLTLGSGSWVPSIKD